MFGRLSPRRRAAPEAAPDAPTQAAPAPGATDAAAPAATVPGATAHGDGTTHVAPIAPVPEQPTAVIPAQPASAPAQPAPAAVIPAQPAQPAQPAPAAPLAPGVPEPAPAVPVAPHPDGALPDAPPGPPPPSFRDRGRLRRRLRHLRRARELAFRDVGGLVFDLHRFGRDGQQLVAGKLAALDTLDAELRLLENRLEDRRAYVDLREPGLAACVRCATLHGSDARFCPRCGLEVDQAAAAPGAPALPAGVLLPAAQPQLPLDPGPPAAQLPFAEAPAADAPAASAAAAGSAPVSSGLGPLWTPSPEARADAPSADAPPAVEPEPPAGA